MVTSSASPSSEIRPPRISSRISRLTYLPNVSFRNSRSRRPPTIRLKPSATAPISSLVTTGQRVSRSPCYVAHGGLQPPERAGHAAGDVEREADRRQGAHRNNEHDENQDVLDNSRRRRRIDPRQRRGARVGEYSEERERDDAQHHEDHEQPDSHAQAQHAGDLTQSAAREEYRQHAPPLVLDREEDERGGHRAGHAGDAEDQSDRGRRGEEAPDRG